MRNLKRVLSLGMTAAMISGLMVSAGAAGYTDVTAEDNVEAIEVLQTVGIMVGDEGGNFNPDQNVTRNEMAVVMSNLMDYRVATYEGTSPFTDVPSWAEPYVAACYTNGIVAGTSATTFGGNDTVTAGQAALMLMKALGYFQYQSDFGSDWLLATTQVATRINLFSGVQAGVREAMTRNDVAQLVLNTLKSTMVDAENNNINVDTGDTSISLGNTKYYYRVDTKGGSSAGTGTGDSKYRAINDSKTATGIDNATGLTLELGEELYEGNLKLTSDPDAYGRPANNWTYKLDKIGDYPQKALEVYTNKVTKTDLQNLLGKSNVDAIANKSNSSVEGRTFSVWADGTNIYDKVYGSAFDTAVRPTYFSTANTSAASGQAQTNGISGKGVQTEVYMDGDGDVTLVYINTYLMKATSDYNAEKGTLDVEIITNPQDFQNSASFTSTIRLYDKDFDLKNYKEDDYILYTVSNGSIESIESAKVVTGKVDAYSKESSVTLDGTKYEYAAKIEGAETKAPNVPHAAQDSASTEYRVTDTASVVVDKNGYVLYVADAEISVGNYLFVNKVATTSGLNQNLIAEAIFTDGTTQEITLDVIKDNASGQLASVEANGTVDKNITVAEVTDNMTRGTTTDINGWYVYSVDANGKYTLKRAETSSVATGLASSEIKNSTVNFAGNGLLANEDTILVVKTEDGVRAYTGVKNFPNITGSGIVVHSFKQDDDSGKYVAVAFVDADKAGITVSDASNKSMLFALKRSSTYVDTAKNETIETWDVLIDGELKKIDFKQAKAPSQYTLYTSYSQDINGYYTCTNAFSNKADSYTATMTDTNNKKPTFTVDGYSLKIDGNSDGTAEGSYVVTNDTKIVVVLQPQGDADIEEMMVDAGASFESKVLTPKSLDNLLGKYALDGTYYLVRENSDSNVLTTLYVHVTGASKN